MEHERLRNLWFANLVNGCCMLMKRKGAPTTTAFSVLGSNFGAVVAGWPAERSVKDQNFFRMQHGVTHDMIRREFVTDLEDSDAAVLRWYAP